MWSSLWPIVWLLGTVPLLVVDYAIQSSPVMMPLRRIRDLVSHGIVAALAIAIVFPVNYIASKRNERWDLAYFRTTAPGTATQAIAASLESPVNIRVFMPPSSEVAQELRAYFGALETSVDFDWYRLKAFALYASGDENTFDSKSEGFDTIFDNPQFAGFDSAYFQRQSIPLIAGGGVILGLLGAYWHLDSRSASEDVTADSFTGQAWTAEDQATFDRAERSRGRAIIAYSAGGVLLVGAAILYMVTEPETEKAVIRPNRRGSPTVTPTDGGAMLGGTWSF